MLFSRGRKRERWSQGVLSGVAGVDTQVPDHKDLRPRPRRAQVIIEQHSGFRCNVLFGKSFVSSNFTTSCMAVLESIRAAVGVLWIDFDLDMDISMAWQIGRQGVLVPRLPQGGSPLHPRAKAGLGVVRNIWLPKLCWSGVHG